MENITKQLMEELREQREAHRVQMTELIQQMAHLKQPAVGGGGGAAAVRPPEVILREKSQSVFNNLMKCTDFKSYKFAQQKTIKEWLRAFDTKVEILARAVELPINELSNLNYVNLVRSKLDDEVVQDVTIKFASSDPVLQWDTITKVRLQEFLIEQYEHKEPQVAALLHVFGSNRYKKSTEDVKSHRSKFWEKLPAFLKPTDEAGRLKLVDILHRTLYYTSLDDAFIQKKLFEISEADQSYQRFYESAIVSEAQRAHYKSTTEETVVLDAASAVSVNKVDNYSPTFHGSGRGRGRQQKQRQQFQQRQQQQEVQQQQYQSTADKYNYKDFRKKKLTCFKCGNVGHFASQCRSDNSSKAHKVSVESLEGDIKMVQVSMPLMKQSNMFKVQTKPVRRRKRSNKFKARRTVDNKCQVLEPGNIMAGVHLHKMCKCTMDLDTAASESMLAYSRYQEILNKCKKKGITPPKLEENAIVMRQADGTSSDSVKGCINLHIRRPDMPEREGRFKVLVVDGPNNVLGRPVLEKLWYEGYQSLAHGARDSRLALSTCTTKSKQDADQAGSIISAPVQKQAVTAGASVYEQLAQVQNPMDEDIITVAKTTLPSKIPVSPRSHLQCSHEEVTQPVGVSMSTKCLQESESESAVGIMDTVKCLLSKLNDYGFIKLVKTNNSYVLDINGVDKHIFGDNLSIIKKVDNANDDSISMNDIIDVSVNEDIISDTESVSEKSEFEFPSGESNFNLNAPNDKKRQHRSELHKWHVGFPLPTPRMRSGSL